MASDDNKGRDGYIFSCDESLTIFRDILTFVLTLLAFSSSDLFVATLWFQNESVNSETRSRHFAHLTGPSLFFSHLNRASFTSSPPSCSLSFLSTVRHRRASAVP